MTIMDWLKKNLGKIFSGVTKEVKKEIETAKKTKTFVLSALPKTAEEMTSMKEFDRKDPLSVSAFTVAAFCRFPESRDDCYAMINDLKGPEPISNMNKEFIRDRFMDGKDYVPRSYFVGATPANDYTTSAPYKVEIIEQSNSRENAGYIRLWITSGGADSPRLIVLRQKPSTGEWFLNQFEFLLGDIRIPKSKDKWA
jgi:hypothetical protein